MHQFFGGLVLFFFFFRGRGFLSVGWFFKNSQIQLKFCVKYGKDVSLHIRIV